MILVALKFGEIDNVFFKGIKADKVFLGNELIFLSEKTVSLKTIEEASGFSNILRFKNDQASRALVGKEIVKMELQDGSIATGLWTLKILDDFQAFIYSEKKLSEVFKKKYMKIEPGETVKITYRI